MIRSCCFTGHRHVPADMLVDIKIDLDVTVRRLIAKGVDAFYCGGARGFDLLAAETVIRLKKTYSHIKLFFILPCKSQTAFWSESDRQRYSFVLSHADDVQCLQEQYTQNCMYERNKELIKSADVCVCYLKEQRSGTAFTVALAAKKHIPVIPLGLNEEERRHFENTFLSAQLNLEDLEFNMS
ncbi:MAG: DUF1273 family protein [Clostridia bacterium]|nr:DUF1273 family protein [Clostridia bacterium]